MSRFQQRLHYTMDVSVNLAVEKNADFEETLARAVKAGFKPAAQYRGLRVASGRIDKTRVSELMRLQGVLSVEEDRDIGTASSLS